MTNWSKNCQNWELLSTLQILNVITILRNCKSMVLFTRKSLYLDMLSLLVT
uniref:Uncharacterized protein n=1 Tax=Megaselia scalaris TaxID=36166 RepID=T1GGX3_MEGSC